MSFAPAALARPGSILITPWSYQSIGQALWTTSFKDPASVSWLAAGLVIYVPFWVPEPVTVTKMFWANGAAVAGNIDVGIYAEDGTRIVSLGTTAQATISELQIADITDTVLQRGRYYMAMVSSTVTTQKVLASVPAAGICQMFGLLEQTGVTLPLSTNASPATFAKYTRAFVPFFGVQGYRTLGPV